MPKLPYSYCVLLFHLLQLRQFLILWVFSDRYGRYYTAPYLVLVPSQSVLTTVQNIRYRVTLLIFCSTFVWLNLPCNAPVFARRLCFFAFYMDPSYALITCSLNFLTFICAILNYQKNKHFSTRLRFIFIIY